MDYFMAHLHCHGFVRDSPEQEPKEVILNTLMRYMFSEKKDSEGLLL